MALQYGCNSNTHAQIAKILRTNPDVSLAAISSEFQLAMPTVERVVAGILGKELPKQVPTPNSASGNAVVVKEQADEIAKLRALLENEGVDPDADDED